jgi:hypothetical protein
MAKQFGSTAPCDCKLAEIPTIFTGVANKAKHLPRCLTFPNSLSLIRDGGIVAIGFTVRLDTPFQPLRTCRNGMLRSTSISLGKPSTRSLMMLRWIWSVPPPIDVK